MAERPIFIPDPEFPSLVREKSLNIIWAGGFAATQKKKNIVALHEAAKSIGIEPVLEASTKSDEKLGQRLSAFNLKVKTENGDLPLECVFQGSKIFEEGGPYTDLYFTDPRSAKRDPRLQQSGKLVAFLFEGYRFPLEPKTVFYDWLYINAIFPHSDWLDRLSRYAAFSDIEFNPQKSLNCQARSLALFVSLKARNLLEKAVSSPECFIDTIRSLTNYPAIQETLKTERNKSTVHPLVSNAGRIKDETQKITSASTDADPQSSAIDEPQATPSSLAEKTTDLSEIPINPLPAPEKVLPDFETFLRQKVLRKPDRADHGYSRKKSTKTKKKK